MLEGKEGKELRGVHGTDNTLQPALGSTGKASGPTNPSLRSAGLRKKSKASSDPGLLG